MISTKVNRVCRGAHENDDQASYKRVVWQVALRACQQICEEDQLCVAWIMISQSVELLR